MIIPAIKATAKMVTAIVVTALIVKPRTRAYLSQSITTSRYLLMAVSRESFVSHLQHFSSLREVSHEMRSRESKCMKSCMCGTKHVSPKVCCATGARRSRIRRAHSWIGPALDMMVRASISKLENKVFEGCRAPKLRPACFLRETVRESFAFTSSTFQFLKEVSRKSFVFTSWTVNLWGQCPQKLRFHNLYRWKWSPPHLNCKL